MADQTKRILIVLENDLYVRNFVTSGAFDALFDSGDVGVVTSEAVVKMADSIPTERLLGSFQRSANSNLVFAYNKLSIRALRRRSTTFDIKVRTEVPFGTYDIRHKIASTPLIFDLLTKRMMRRRFQPNKSLLAIVQSLRPELVIFPFTGVEASGYELVRMGPRFGFRTLFLVNGWDNLSSKGIMPFRPDFIGVWGPQSAEDAKRIQGMPPDRVLLMGCARYEGFAAPEIGREPPFEFPYVLFAGSTTACEEIGPLQEFDRALTASGRSDLKIVYRPHPQRERRLCEDVFRPEEFRNVVIDPQVAEGYFGAKERKTENTSSQQYPALTYYPGLLRHARFVVSPMSSMTLEAALFDVPAMILAYDDGYHPIPGNLQASYRHFEGADTVPGWFFARSKSELRASFESMVERTRREHAGDRAFRPALSDAMRRYLHTDEIGYSRRLENAAREILNARR